MSFVRSVFQEELAALGRFIEILQKEQAALVDTDVDRLAAISQEKSGQAEKLMQLGRQRVEALAHIGIASDAASVEAWIGGQPREVQAAWQALLESARAAQHLNQVNGKMVETQLQQTQRALQTLTNAANPTSVYGADGQTRGLDSHTQRTLGKG